MSARRRTALAEEGMSLSLGLHMRELHETYPCRVGGDLKLLANCIYQADGMCASVSDWAE
jgi:hypothetical protein